MFALHRVKTSNDVFGMQ